jgi:flagellum-specific peptidoglycan hydrolase FlgJ
LEDYGYYYSRYLSGLDTEDEYYEYLSQNYAEDPRYVETLKAMIIKENLKSKFN